jgi:hypothetical protein
VRELQIRSSLISKRFNLGAVSNFPLPGPTPIHNINHTDKPKDLNSRKHQSITQFRLRNKNVQAKRVLEVGRRFFDLLHRRKRSKHVVIPLLVPCDLPVVDIPELPRPVAHRRQWRRLHRPGGLATARRRARSRRSHRRRRARGAVSGARGDGHSRSRSSNRPRHAPPQRPSPHSCSTRNCARLNPPPQNVACDSSDSEFDQPDLLAIASSTDRSHPMRGGRIGATMVWIAMEVWGSEGFVGR